MVINYCFVPTCVNNSHITPNKKFLKVPVDANIRKTWALAVGISAERISTSGTLRCCEDHFDLEQDAENWMQYTMMATQLRLKKNIIPHLNFDRKEVINTDSQISSSSKKRKADNIKQFISCKKQLNFDDSEPSTSTTTTDYVTPIKNTDYSHNVWSPSGDFQVSVKPLAAGEDSSTLNRGIEFVDVNSIDNNSNSESINYRSNVLCESVNIKIEYNPENIQHYEHLTHEYQQEFNIKTEIDIKEEIM